MLVVVTAAFLAAPADRASATPPPRRPGGVGLRLLEAPAEATDPRAELYIIDHVAPGTVVTRHVEVSNTTTDPFRAKVYPAAAAIVSGSFVGAAGDTSNELSSWTDAKPSQVDVPADSQVAGTVTITVPRDASPGERYAVVWAEVSTVGSPGGGVTEVSRVGIRLYLSVGAGGAPAADFAIESTTAARTADGAPEIRATIQNTGGRAVDLAGTVMLSDGPAGLRAGPYPISVGTTVEPGTDGSVRSILDEQLPAGPWEVEILLRSGSLERRAHATITFPMSGINPAVDAEPDDPARSSALPIAAGVIAAVLMLSLLVHRDCDLCKQPSRTERRARQATRRSHQLETAGWSSRGARSTESTLALPNVFARGDDRHLTAHLPREELS